jgi:undecaprenyl-phosphate 4-deoxy-4-formamido-L-arabinose transferase
VKIELISLVIPVFNEEANLDELIQRCSDVGKQFEAPYELILVDDGSRDKSAQLITDAAEASAGTVVAVLLNRNYGQHAAVMAGFGQARGDVVVTLDADLQNPPEEIPKLIRKVREGSDVVGSVRRNRQDSRFRRLSSRLINKAVRMSTGVMMHDYGCMLRAYHRDVIDAMLQCHERSTFIPVLANSFARSPTEVDVDHADRARDASKYNVWKLINLQFDLLTSMTTAPLRLLSISGAGLAIAGFLFSLILLAGRLVFGPVWAGEGVFTVFAVLFIFVGVQLVAMGLLGEYVGRIYTDVRARPRYFIHRIIGRDEVESQHTLRSIDEPCNKS